MQVEQLNYQYRSAGEKAVQAISYRFEPGKIYGIIGPNGVGKTTLLSLLAGILKPHSGTISGFDELGVLIQGIGMYDEANATENLQIFCAETKISPEHINYVLSLVGIDAAQSKVKLKACSQGFKQRMFIARSLLRCQGVIVLDEPFSALDYDNVKLVASGLQRLVREKGATILISSHRLREVEKIIDLAIFMNEGRIIGTTNMQGAVNQLTIGCPDTKSAATTLSSHLPAVQLATFAEGITVRYDDPATYQRLLELLLHNDIEWTSIEKSRSLTQAYDQYIKP